MGWAYKATHAPRPFSDILCTLMYVIPPVVPYLWQSIAPYITETHCFHWFHTNVYLNDEIWIQITPLQFVPCKFLVVHVSPTRTRELNSHHQHSPMRVEDKHTTGRCPVPRRDHLRHCYHHLSAMQPSAQCLTPWLRWTRALFAVLGRYPSATMTPRVGFWRG
jgi:hypothetical protein